MENSVLRLPLNLTPEEIYPFLGMDSGKSIPSDIAELIGYSLEQIRLKAGPLCLYKTFPVRDVNPDRISLTGSELTIEAEKTAAHFQTAARVSLLAVTIGSAVDALIKEQPPEASARLLILDGTASAAVENITEQLDAIIVREIRRQGFYPTARFSPGYGDWPLSGQKPFLESIQAARIGLSATPHFLLQPVKSVTAIIGWSRIPVERNYRAPERILPCKGVMSCGLCPLAGQCIHRSEER